LKDLYRYDEWVIIFFGPGVEICGKFCFLEQEQAHGYQTPYYIITCQLSNGALHFRMPSFEGSKDIGQLPVIPLSHHQRGREILSGYLKRITQHETKQTQKTYGVWQIEFDKNEFQLSPIFNFIKRSYNFSNVFNEICFQPCIYHISTDIVWKRQPFSPFLPAVCTAKKEVGEYPPLYFRRSELIFGPGCLNILDGSFVTGEAGLSEDEYCSILKRALG
jgi:hypothetical protein